MSGSSVPPNALPVSDSHPSTTPVIRPSPTTMPDVFLVKMTGTARGGGVVGPIHKSSDTKPSTLFLLDPSTDPQLQAFALESSPPPGMLSFSTGASISACTLPLVRLEEGVELVLDYLDVRPGSGEKKKTTKASVVVLGAAINKDNHDRRDDGGQSEERGGQQQAGVSNEGEGEASARRRQAAQESAFARAVPEESAAEGRLFRPSTDASPPTLLKSIRATIRSTAAKVVPFPSSYSRPPFFIQSSSLLRRPSISRLGLTLGRSLAVCHVPPLQLARFLFSVDGGVGVGVGGSEDAASRSLSACARRLGVSLNSGPAAPTLAHRFGPRSFAVLRYRKVAERKVAEILEHLFLQQEEATDEWSIFFGPIKESDIPVTIVKPAIPDDVEVIKNCYEIGVFKIAPFKFGCATLSLFVKTSYETDLKKSIRLSLLKERLHVVKVAQHMFDRRVIVDACLFADFINTSIPRAPPPNSSERSLLDDSLRLFSDSSNFRRLPNSLATLKSVDVFQRVNAGERLAWGKCSGLVDDSAPLVLAYLFSWNSCERLASALRQHGSGKVMEWNEVPNSRSAMLTQEVLLPPPFGTSVFKDVQYVWEKQVAAQPPDGSERYVLGWSNTARNSEETPAERENRDSNKGMSSSKPEGGARTRGVYYIESVAPRVSRVTLLHCIDLGGIGILPSWLMNKRMIFSFNLFLELQEHFARSDKEIDKDVRSAFLKRIPAMVTTPLNPEQKQTLVDCRELMTYFERAESEMNIISLKSPLPLVNMWMTNERKRKSFATGKGETTVDCSAGEVVAWLHDFCSRARSRLCREEGNPARLVLSDDGLTTKTVAKIKTFPWPLAPREFATVFVWTVSDPLALEFGIKSIEVDVDYGFSSFNVVKAKTVGYYSVKPLSLHTCKVTLYQRFDAGGIIPASAINSLVPDFLTVMGEISADFVQDDEYDRQNRASLAMTMEERPQEYTSHETEIVNRVLAKFRPLLGEAREAAVMVSKTSSSSSSSLSKGWSALSNRLQKKPGTSSSFQELDSPDVHVKMRSCFFQGEANIIGWAAVTVDESFATCAAWDYTADS